MYKHHARGQELEKIHKLFQRLWTKAVGTPGYEKREWSELQRLIEALADPPKDKS